MSIIIKPLIKTEPFLQNMMEKKLNQNKKQKVLDIEVRTNFDCPLSLKKQIRKFIAEDENFKSNKEFFIQCIKDGLEKYKSNG